MEERLPPLNREGQPMRSIMGILELSTGYSLRHT